MLLDLLNNPDSAKAAIGIPGGPTLTYEDLRRQVHDLSKTLSRFGLGQGDRIAMALPNGLEVIACFLAASAVGTAAPLNPAYTRDEFKFYLEDTGARALIVPPTGSKEARAATGADVLIIEVDLDAEGRVRFAPKGNAGATRPRGLPK